jgi:NADH dehydrogenase
MNARVVTVFGGTGFLGRRVVEHLRKHGFFVRIASRHADRGRELFGADASQFQFLEADIHDPQAVAEALAGAYGAVNAVSLYVEREGQTFHCVHVEAARRLAARARQDGLERLVQVSGIGADAASPSLYIRKRGEGELSVRAAFPDAIVVRPAVMFGPDDAFLTPILALLRKLPVFPMFGRSLTRLQPAYVGDVAEAIAKAPRNAGKTRDHVRVWRASHLFLRRLAQSGGARRGPRRQARADAVCGLACARVDGGDAPEPSCHPQPDRADAGR